MKKKFLRSKVVKKLLKQKFFLAYIATLIFYTISVFAFPFLGAVSTSVGDGPDAIAYGDFDHDGDADLAVANNNGNTVSILLNNGAGTLSINGTVSVGTQPKSIVAGDFNRDGDLDLATANQGSSNVSITPGNGSGGFGAATNIATAATHDAITAGDFDNDGDLDLVVTNTNVANNFSILLGDGAGSFAAETTFGGGSANFVGIAAGDFDNNGNLDVVLARTTGAGGFLVYLGNGAGSFAAGVGYETGTIYNSVIVKDFHHDGFLDLVGTDGSSSVVVVPGNGDGTFGAGTSYNAGTNTNSVIAEDYDHDGDIDLAVANTGDDTISVFLNDGSGGFTSAGDPLATGDEPIHIQSVDLNSDGESDLVTANFNADNVSVVLDEGEDGTGRFVHATDYIDTANGDTPLGYVVKTVDVNNDGDLDVVGVNYEYDKFSVILGDGTGSFGFPIIHAPQSGAMDIAVADVNHDGDLDAAIAHNNATFAFSIWLGNGTGNFVEDHVYNVAGPVPSLTFGDFNRDGDVDVAIIEQTSNLVIIYTGNGDGTFVVGNSYSVSGSNFVTADDLDHDGDLDLVATLTSTDQVAVLLGNGDGTFAAAVNYNAGDGPYFIAVDDFDHDGDADLAVANALADSVSILSGNGDGTFNSGSTFATGPTLIRVTLEDFDYDGNTDILAVSENAFSHQRFLGNGDGTFGSSYTVMNPFNSVLSFDSGDFNHDGNLDLVAGGGADSIFLGDNTPPVLAEVTAVTTPTSGTTPDYTFSTTEAGTITYDGDCSSATTNASSGNNTITFDALADGVHNNCTVTVTDEAGNPSIALNVTAFTVDTTAPVLSEFTSVATPANDTTPDYTFTSTEAGTITYSGDCSSATTSASSGSNTITFNALATGEHQNCIINVTDQAGNESSDLNVTSFTIQGMPPGGSGNVTFNPQSQSSTPDGTDGTTPDGTDNGESSDGESSDEPSSEISQEVPDVFEPSEEDSPWCAGYIDISLDDPDCAAIKYVKTLGIMTGNSDGTFHSDGYLQRDETAKIALNYFELFDPSVDYCQNKKPFPDIELTDWSAQYICRGATIKVITGYLGGENKGKFIPANQVNRAELLALLFRNVNTHSPSLRNYADIVSGQWYEMYARDAYYHHLFPGTVLSPEKPLSRREVARILYLLRNIREQYVSEVSLNIF